MPSGRGRVSRIEATFIFLMVVLKLPIAALFYIVWWAIRAVPEPEQGSDGDGGSMAPRHPRAPRPQRPRRGPHGDPPLDAPARTRTTVAAGRRVER